MQFIRNCNCPQPGNGCRSMYERIQAGVPEIRIVFKFTAGRVEAFQLKEAEKEVEKWQDHTYTDLLQV